MLRGTKGTPATIRQVGVWEGGVYRNRVGGWCYVSKSSEGHGNGLEELGKEGEDTETMTNG